MTQGEDNWTGYRDTANQVNQDFADPGGFVHKSGAKGGDTPPPAPDYIGAAREQGQQNIALARVNAMLNNPNIKNALGQQKVTFNADGTPNIEQILNPTQQGIFDTMQQTQSGLAGQAATNLSQPLDYSNVSGLTGKAYEAISSRLEPQFQRDEDALRTRLANQGIGSGTQAYNTDVDAFGRAKNDARLQGVLSALQYGPSLLQQDVAVRDQPLNEMNAIQQGTKASLPQFSAFNPSANAQAGNYQGAVDKLGQYNTDIWNYGQAQNAQKRNNLMSAASLAAMMFI